MMPPHPCQLTKGVEYDHVLTAKQSEFAYRELNTSNNTIHTKKVMIPSITEKAELHNVYQKMLTTGCKTDIRPNDKAKSPVQMKEWSILSDHVKHITSDKSETFNNLSTDQLNYRKDISLYGELQEKESLNTDLNFGNSSIKLKSKYVDVYERIYAEIVSLNRFD